ncbi:MAG: putative zinc-binding protein [Candidatus Promineifilaceae bacterium]
MPKLPQKKVGIVACSGEELPEGTVTRMAALQVLEQLRPSDTVTICLPLFLAGGEGDRAFARFYPTIAVDGCELRCAARATEMYSGKPAASVVVSDIVATEGIGPIEGLRRLNEAGQRAVGITAERMAFMVDELLDKRWSRRQGDFIEDEKAEEAEESSKTATCACGSGIPIQSIAINGQSVTLVGLPLIFEQFQTAGKAPNKGVAGEMLETIKIYNPIPATEEDDYTEAILREYRTLWEEKEPVQ